MIASDPSLRSRLAPAAAFTWYTPGRALAGSASVTVKLLASSSRWNDRLSDGTVPPQPGGGVCTTFVDAGPRARVVTVTVDERGSVASSSSGQSSTSGVTVPSNQ